MGNLVRELQRRNVIRVAAAYLVVGWIVMQVVDVIGAASGMPGWASSFALIILIVGFPVVLFIAWAFELTPEGIKQTASVPESESRTAETGQILNYAILGAVIVLVAIIGWRQLAPSDTGSGAQMAATQPVSGPEAVQSETENVAEPAPAASSDHSIAVLPFEAFSNEDSDRFFADGLTEEILNALAALPDIRVTSRTSSFQFRGAEIPPIPEVAARLGVNHVLEGSVRSSGNRVRVTAQLIRASDDAHLWSQTYDRTLDDVFAIQEEIAVSVADILEVAMDERARQLMRDSGARSIEAFVAFQQGQEIFRERHLNDTETQLGDASALFERATELDPRFSEAYLLWSDQYAHEMIVLVERSLQRVQEDASGEPVTATFDQEAFDAAHAEHTRLLELAEETAPDEVRGAIAHANRLLFSDDWQLAYPIIETVMQTDLCVEDNYLNTLVAFAEPSMEHVNFYSEQVACDPLNSTIWSSYERVLFANGLYDRALEAHREHLELGIVTTALGQSEFLAMDIMMAQGRFDEVDAILQEPGLDPRGVIFFALRLASLRGDAEAASELAEQVLAIPGLPTQFEVLVYAMIGDRENANAAAALVDSRPLSPVVLSQMIGFCSCGAPFDLEAAPNFAARLAEAGFPWPPATDFGYPLKDW
ncbi:hypothetical protein V0U79_00355 [Hyphobacterium sp. HN65]|uniref:FlgO domain-containing protein n=1 Tax=Hyphobacterium lacteum TaxID=3116575 RepID=A0ABU7LLN7_9PROT|nr:hypothetical protein [Hyphobacterium sp. HN65]MEE2524802.1 hypothetical protein [Hyphobacterium sp. HN65]